MSSVFPHRRVGGVRTTIALCLAAKEGREGKPAVRHQNNAPTAGHELPDNRGGAS